jgi:tRNA 2-selenouridine synthase
MIKKMNGININLETTFDQRVKLLVAEYVEPYKNEPWYESKISEGIEKVLRRIKDIEIRNRLNDTLENRNYEDMIRILLEHYYDPRYDHARQEYKGEFIDIFAENPVDSANKISAILDRLFLITPQSLEK